MAMTRRDLLTAALAPKRRTNVVLFMTDDHGAWAWGRGGCPTVSTPNLDRLAAEGVQFDNAFAATPVCSPSRMTYLTGLLPSTHGVQDYLLPKDSTGPDSRQWLEGKTTYSEVLRDAGYNLGLCGKWHMGLDETPQAGFTWWATIPGGGGTYRNPTFVKNGQTIASQGFKTDLLGDFALEFLDQQKDSRRPFYLLMPFYAPHTPYDYQPEKYRDRYAAGNFPCFPNTPVHPAQNEGLRRHHGNAESMRSYSALISAVDANVGRVVDKLAQIGAREDTLVIFTADQGWNAGHHGVWGKGNGTWPFNMYEESVRVPMIWNLPGRLKPRRTPAMVSSYDYFDTILEVLGVPRPKDARRVGRSYAPALRGDGLPGRDRLFFEYCYTRAVRTSRWKYIERTRDYPTELYDLQADPGETRNLHPVAESRSLAAGLSRFFASAGAPLLENWRSTTRQNLNVYPSAAR